MYCIHYMYKLVYMLHSINPCTSKTAESSYSVCTVCCCKSQCMGACAQIRTPAAIQVHDVPSAMGHIHTACLHELDNAVACITQIEFGSGDALHH